MIRMGHHVRTVPRAFRSLCLLLAICWVPLTQHCRLEAFGWVLPECEHAAAVACVDDSCGPVENGGYKNGATNLKLAKPLLAVTIELLSALAARPATAVLVSADFPDARSREWIPIWQFERRAAPPSRAPSEAQV